MKLLRNEKLRNYLTMRLGGSASFVAEINQKSEIADVMNFAREHQLKTFVLGEGSNTLANDDGFEGIILHMKIKKPYLHKGVERHTI